MIDKIRKYRNKLQKVWKKPEMQPVVSMVHTVAVIIPLVTLLVVMGYAAWQGVKVIAVVLGVLFPVILVAWGPDALERFIEGIGEKPQTIVQYPVYFGYEGGRVVPNSVDSIFQEMYGMFAACYFFGFAESASRVLYSFKYSLKPNMTVDYNFIMLLQKIAEHILNRQLSDYNVTGVKSQDLVVLDISNNKLEISFAKNGNGIQEVLEIQHYIREKYLGKGVAASSAGKFTDVWSRK